MNREALMKRTRSLLRDLNNSTFRQIDITDYINEGIERVIMVIPEMKGMRLLEEDNETPIILPVHYHHLLALYSAARCYAQDERPHQAVTLMNEFEIKLAQLRDDVLSGEIELEDEDGNIIDLNIQNDHVVDVYFGRRRSD